MDIGGKFNSKRGNILILTYWSFSDALIQTYTLPYVRMIRRAISDDRKIFLLTLEKSLHTHSSTPTLLAGEDNIVWVPLRYYAFGLKALTFWSAQVLKLWRTIRSKNIQVIHCWGSPAGAIGFLLSRLTGRTLILDSYEPHAEAMIENGTWSKRGLAFQMLFWLEKKQSRRAAVFISATEGMKQYALKKYGTDARNFFVKPAGVDLDRFDLSQVKKPEIMSALGFRPEHIVCVYAGKFGGIYLEQEVFDFFRIAAAYWKDAFRVLLLTNTAAELVDRYCADAGLPRDKVIVRFVQHSEVPPYMGVADFAITPVKPVPSKRYCTPIKDGEYWALGLPVVIPQNISDDSSIVETHDIGAVLGEFNEGAYLKAVMKIDKVMKRPNLRHVIREVAADHRSFSHAEIIYRKIYS